jgi:hypothetical protein
MGFLALAALALALLPGLFDLGFFFEGALEAIQWGIVFVFAVEYAAGFALSTARRRFVRSPWRLLDLVIILAPLVSLLPHVGGALRSSPALRLLRLLRVIVFGARASGAAMRGEAPAAMPTSSGPVAVTAVTPKDVGTPRPRSWEQFLAWLTQQAGEWYHVSGVNREA